MAKKATKAPKVAASSNLPNGKAGGKASSNGQASPKKKAPKIEFGTSWDYAPAPESAGHANIKEQYKLFINGKWQEPSSGKYFESTNPATEEKLAEVAWANEADVDTAVKAAREAYDNVWSKMPGKERGKYIYRIARMIQEKAREFAVIESMDGGKVIRESRDVDVPLAAAHFFYKAGWADKLVPCGPLVERLQPLAASLGIEPAEATAWWAALFTKLPIAR